MILSTWIKKYRAPALYFFISSLYFSLFRLQAVKAQVVIAGTLLAPVVIGAVGAVVVAVEQLRRRLFSGAEAQDLLERSGRGEISDEELKRGLLSLADGDASVFGDGGWEEFIKGNKTVEL